MDYCFITLRSLTTAQKAESILRRNGIACRLQRTPRWMEEQGCGNGIRVDCENIEVAVMILKRNNISYKRVYLGSENGKMEEMLS